ncbi:DUF166 domain-containing protein [Archaeoglobus veneficus]|uniref:Thymidylate synthase n=1 Tax=Archaeoglobus veneficus (strain DSM 11195 / SNP6) TaxID=693661 RepID=F2KN02_ARCVS|nr:DUF166 family protein [Archaeoglobus veneficus]AEA47278.1 protein of unknown function DUF166 [Archaeoglobus veneficus SNP6]
MKIGIIARGRHGPLTARMMSEYFEVSVFELPEELPVLIEDIELPENILNSDIIISYAAHPDVNIRVVEGAKARLVILTGKSGKTGSRAQLKAIAEERGVRLLMVDICCVASEIEGFEEFFNRFGKPEFEVKIRNGVLEDVKVTRCAFCGATCFVAERLKGAIIEDAPRLAGYYTQIYPCLASRGIKGGIHLAAEMHKIAMERAIKAAKDIKDK